MGTIYRGGWSTKRGRTKEVSIHEVVDDVWDEVKEQVEALNVVVEHTGYDAKCFKFMAPHIFHEDKFEDMNAMYAYIVSGISTRDPKVQVTYLRELWPLGRATTSRYYIAVDNTPEWGEGRTDDTINIDEVVHRLRKDDGKLFDQRVRLNIMGVCVGRRDISLGEDQRLNNYLLRMYGEIDPEYVAVETTSLGEFKKAHVLMYFVNRDEAAEVKEAGGEGFINQNKVMRGLYGSLSDDCCVGFVESRGIKGSVDSAVIFNKEGLPLLEIKATDVGRDPRIFYEANLPEKRNMDAMKRVVELQEQYR